MKINEENKERIQKLRRELEALAPEEGGTGVDAATSYSELELDSYLQFQKTVPAAAKALVASRKWKEDHAVTIADIAPFCRAPAGSNQSSPAGCLVCLEDGKGDVARDHEGRPIVCMIGMVHGNEEELKEQTAYALQRASLYRLPHDRPDEVCFVTEVLSRDTNSLSPTFRFPDAGVRAFFDFMKAYYPGSQFSIVHFCGLPSFVVGFFKMLKPFISAEIFGRLKLKSSFAHLKKGGYIQPSSLLPNWDKDGTFNFDLDQYVEWRAHEEGISSDQICPRGQGRSYTGSNTAGMGINCSVTMKEVMGTPEGREKVILKGWAEKKGSGVGLFSSNRWKSKYLVLTPGLLLYFESAKVSETNAASRMIPIDESSCLSSIGRLSSSSGTQGENNKKAMVCFQSAGREYEFSFSSEKEAEKWDLALRKQCEGSVLMTDDDDDMTDDDDDKVCPSPAKTLCVGDY